MPPNDRIRVLCVDDSADIADLYATVISGESDMEVVGTLSSADRLSEEAVRVRPQIVLLDLTMPGKPPLDALSELGDVAPETRVIVFSGYDDPETKDQVFDAGAWELVSKHDDVSAVLAAIRRVARGDANIRGGV